MLYKTMVQELLQQHPKLYRRLCHERKMLPTLNLLAEQLRIRHLQLMTELQQCSAAGESSAISSAAREIAIAEIESLLKASSDSDERVTEMLERIKVDLAAASQGE